MFRLSPRCLSSLLALLCLIIVFALCLSQSASAQTNIQAEPPTRKTPPPATPPAPVDQQQFISYWTTETGWQTELELRNNQVKEALTVTPVVRATDGSETALALVTIQPQDVQTFDVEAAIGASAPQLIGAFGSVVLRYTASSFSALYAVAMVHGLGHSVAFHIDGIGEDKSETTGGREGIWWLPNTTANDYLVITNQGKSALPLQLTLFDAGGKSAAQNLTLPPAAMNRLSVRQLLKSNGLAGSYGGIQLSAASHAGSLNTLHVVFDENAGFSAMLKMFDYDPRTKLSERDYAATGTWTLRAPMLALSTPDPALAFPFGTRLRPELLIRNTTAKIIDASLRFTWRAGAATGKAAGPHLRLLPYESRLIDVAALQDGTTLPQNANWAAVILTSNALPDELMAVAASYDQELKYGAQTPFSDQLAFHWAGSQWEYDPYHNSIITVGNGGTKPATAAFTIVYNQGTQKYELEQPLQPDEQMWVDIGKRIREHAADKNGKTLPLDLTSGSYEIRDLTNKGIGELFEGKIIYDTTYGHVTYGCGVCCAYKPPVLISNPLGIPFQGTSSNGVDAYDTCSNSEVNVTYMFNGNWSTANSSIATVDAYGTHTGQGVGSTTTSTWGDIQQWEPHSFNCPIQRPSPGGGDNTTPTISQSAPLWFFGKGIQQSGSFILGATTATLTANGGGNGTYVWTITAGTSKATLENNSSTITKTNVNTVGISSTSWSTAMNDVTVQLQYTPAGGSQLLPINWNLSIDSPYKLVLNGSVNTTGIVAGAQACEIPSPTGTDGFQTLVPYSMKSFFGVQITLEYLNETFGLQNDDSPNNWPLYSPINGFNATGNFFDNICMVATGGSLTPQPLPPQSPLGTVAIDHGAQYWYVGSQTSGSGVEVQYDTLQRYQDHGAVPSATIVSPVRQ